MCGLVGTGWFESQSPTITDKAIKDTISQFFLTELLIETVKRGEHATGIGLVERNNGYAYIKAGWDAHRFMTYTNPEKSVPRLIEWWNKYDVTFAMGHDRKRTVGPEWQNNNNHPIHRGNILMVHNGTIVNQDKIFKEIKDKVDPPKGVVDSEAIAAWLEAYYNETPFDKKGVIEMVSKCDGALTIFAVNRLFPSNILITRAGRPLEMCYNKKLNFLVLLSDDSFLNPVIKLWNRHIAREVSCGYPTINYSDFEIVNILENSAMILNLADIPSTTFKEYLDERLFEIKPQVTTASYASWTENTPVTSVTTKPYTHAITHQSTTTTATNSTVSKYAKTPKRDCIITSAIKITATSKEIAKTEHKMNDTTHPTINSIESAIDYVGETAWACHLDKMSDTILIELGDNGINEIVDKLSHNFREITSGTIVDEIALRELVVESVEEGIKEGVKRGVDREYERWANLKKTQSEEIERLTELAAAQTTGVEGETKLLKTMLLGLIQAASSGEVPRDKILDYLVLALNLPENAVKQLFTSKELETYSVEL